MISCLFEEATEKKLFKRPLFETVTMLGHNGGSLLSGNDNVNDIILCHNQPLRILETTTQTVHTLCKTFLKFA